jgi:hypothetical protein
MPLKSLAAGSSKTPKYIPSLSALKKSHLEKAETPETSQQWKLPLKNETIGENRSAYLLIFCRGNGLCARACFESH